MAAPVQTLSEVSLHGNFLGGTVEQGRTAGGIPLGRVLVNTSAIGNSHYSPTPSSTSLPHPFPWGGNIHCLLGK